MPINTDFLVRCINTLESAFGQLQEREPGDALYDIFRAAAVKEFELVLEQSGNLLKKRLQPYFASNRQADRLTFKDAFRYAAKHDLISVEACERWFAYRDNRNDTAHDYGEEFAETTLRLLPQFIMDARELASAIAEGTDD
jgi:nucleotidyltransferase substrate binding protein (TIGR01987 family)